MLELDAGDDRERAREVAKARLIALEKRIAELNRTRDALERLVSECSSGKSGPCPILQSFESIRLIQLAVESLDGGPGD